LPAVILIDSDNDGIPDTVEALLLTNPIVADGRSLVKGNGDSVAGLNSPVLLAAIPVYQPFSMPLTVSGGTAPYSWNLVAGSLPNGLSLGSTTGTISGTPTTVGLFNFFYKVQDANGLNASTISQIDVKPLPVLARTPAISYFGALQSAYDAQLDGGSVTLQTNEETLTEDLICDREVTVLLGGAYDETFTNRTGVTVLNGSLTIRGGQVSASGITIR
jgi:hypothetical protein